MKVYQIDRKIQIKQFDDMSILSGKQPVGEVSITMAPTEKYVLQLAVVPEEESKIEKIQIVGAVDIYCINTQIVDKFAKRYEIPVPLEVGQIQPLFFVIDAGEQGTSQSCELRIVTDKNEQSIQLAVHVSKEVVQNHGYDDLWRLSRLDWLNSTRFTEDAVTKPFTPPVVDKSKISILGREVTVGNNGMPSQITTFFDQGINLKKEVQKEILQAPMELLFGDEPVCYGAVELVQKNSSVAILATGETKQLSIKTTGILAYEGMIDYQVCITAKQDVKVASIKQVTALNPDCAQYMNGLGVVGGKAKPHSFQWSHKEHLDCLYMGTVNAGIRLKWKAENYIKPLVNIYYKNMPLNVPEETWDNHKKGTITVVQGSAATVITADTSDFAMKQGETRTFALELHITPLKPIDYNKHYSVRYSHNNALKNEYKEIDRAEKLKLNNVIIHHGNGVHPFINYPFIEVERMKAMVDYAAKKDIGIKMYYTTREHGNHMAEVFVYKALGDEIILRKKGEGYSWQGGTAKWLTEYFGDKIIPAWKVEYRSGKYKGDPDVSFIVRPNSRLDNYYIEGLDWLVKNIGIKGIYIDDTALDRTTLERARKVLSQNDGLIDMHMWNHEEERAGNVSCMNLYTELFAFIDTLWIGEGYPYKRLSPDYILTEVSGIPYGQTSQMLEGGGEPFLGMLYAMNNRYSWGAFDAWKMYDLWDSFQIQDSEMRGYWHSQNPATTGNANVLATTYVKENEALVCLYNFGNQKEEFQLSIDEKLLGFSVNSMEQAYIPKMQKNKKMAQHKPIKLKKKSGVILLIKK